jgi:hypothetical protein
MDIFTHDAAAVPLSSPTVARAFRVRVQDASGVRSDLEARRFLTRTPEACATTQTIRRGTVRMRPCCGGAADSD